MTIEDIKEYKKNAVEILRKHDQYATAKAVEEAFMALACLGQGVNHVKEELIKRHL